MTPLVTTDALVEALNREPIELADGVTPEEVMRLALDGIDIAYRAHGEGARVSLLAVQADWIMQHLARTEAWARDEQAKRHAAEDKLVEARSRAALAEAALATANTELTRFQAEGEAKDRALKLLLPFVDYAAGEGLMFRGSDDTERPEMDAADICCAVAEALGMELGDPEFLALVEEGQTAIAARAATAREGA